MHPSLTKFCGAYWIYTKNQKNSKAENHLEFQKILKQLTTLFIEILLSSVELTKSIKKKQENSRANFL